MDCLGGKGRKSMILSPRAAVQGQFTWEVQKGTKDLFVEVLCEPMASSEGSAKLSAECKGEDGKALLTILGDDDDDGLLNHQVRKAHTHGAEWSWSGNPESKNGSSTLWLRVKGTLHCDVSFSLENDYVANMATDLRYKWSGIDPCPQQLKGCAPCPDDKCHEDDVAQCDGSPYWECFPKTLLAKATATTSIPILPPEGAPGPPSTSIDKSATAESHPPLSFEDILADPQLRAILRAQQSDEPSLPFERPVPTSHPAVTLLQSDRAALDQTQLSPRLRGGVGDQNRRMHDGSAVMLAALVSCFIIGLALCTGARSTSTRHSGTAPEGLQQQQSEVRAHLGAAIQGRRTMYHLVQDGSLPSSPTAEAGP